MRFLRARQGQQPGSVPRCKWCGNPVETGRWKDGRNFYCSSGCLQAGLFPALTFCAVFLTPFLVGTIITPDAMFYFFWAGSGGRWGEPIQGISPLASMIVWGGIAVVCVSSIIFWLMAYRGWRYRRDIRVERSTNSPNL